MAESAESPTRSFRTLSVLRRIPVTLTIVTIVLVVGVIGQGLWSATENQSWYDSVAYGLPALEAGRFWTPITGTFFVASPAVYIPTLLSFIGVGLLEYGRGSRVTLAYFGIGQLFAIFATALFLFFASMTPWPWAIDLAGQLDVGASGGTMACIAACVGMLPQPWRQRAWVVVFGYAAISLLFLGSLADIEHTFAIVLVLAVDRSFRIQRTSIREQRLIAFGAIIGLGAVQILTLLVPTNGPFGATAPLDGPWIDVLIDTVIIIIVARGLRLGRRWAWVLTVIWGTLGVLIGILYLVVALFARDQIEDQIGDVDVAIASSGLWLAFVIYLVVTRHAFGARRRRPLGTGKDAVVPTLDEARALITANGGGNLSWMATWEGMQFFRTSGGLVPYQVHAGVAIVLADPLGPPASVAASVDEFVRAAEHDSLVPCFFSASQITKDAIPDGWRDLIIADDTIVDLPGLAFTGKSWSHVRQAMNRGPREGMTFRMTTLAAEPWGIRQQLRAISEGWVGEKGLPEMRFTLGRLQEAEDPEVRLALAISPEGNVDGFLSWLPVFGPEGEHRGWTLDLMRRRDDGFQAVMEYLIGSSAQAFSEEGAQILSLSGAPLAHEVTPDEGLIAQLLGQLAGTLEPVYGFSSLHKFKQKFNPRYEPIYLLYRDEGDLPAIAAGLTRAFLPDATLRQFAAAGVDVLRGK